MSTLTDLIVNFGDVIQLDWDFDLTKIKYHLASSDKWKQYNPRKDIKRYGISVTSLDGEYSGIPDLDSLREYNRINGTSYSESDFKTRTLIAEETGISDFLDVWGGNLSRSHFIRLDAGGFFPHHRDGAKNVPAQHARIVVPIKWDSSSIWLHEDKLLNLREGVPYFINTAKIHSLFSYVDWTTILVLNVDATPDTVMTITRYTKTV